MESGELSGQTREWNLEDLLQSGAWRLDAGVWIMNNRIRIWKMKYGERKNMKNRVQYEEQREKTKNGVWNVKDKEWSTGNDMQ